MQNNQIKSSKFYLLACTSIVVGLFMQDFFKVPLTGGVILIGLSWIFTFRFKDKIQNLITQPVAIGFFLFYLTHLLSIIYTQNLDAGWSDLQLKITLLLLPLFMMSTHLFSSQKKMTLLQLFAVLMIIMSVADIAMSLSDYIITENSNVFYYKQLPHILSSKPHYVAWYYSFAMFIVMYQIIAEKKHRALWFVGFGLLVGSLILLSSRAYVLAFFIVFIVSFLAWVMTNKVTKSLWMKLLIGLVCLVTILFFNPKTNSRINDTIVEIQKFMGADTHRQTNPRVYLWDYAVDLIAERPLLGYGVGDAKDELNNALKNCDAKFWDGEKNVPIHAKNLNFHNQFLQTWAEVGILGFLLLAFLMIQPFFLKNQHPLFLIFVGLTLIGFLTESMLERQAGVVLFAFMYPLLAGLKRTS